MKVKVTSTVQQVANRISPGISRLRGVILYELQVLNDDDEVMITISREDEMMIITSSILKVNWYDKNCNQATLAAYARRKFSSGEISTEHMRNIMKVASAYNFNKNSASPLEEKKLIFFQEVKKYLLECIQIFSFEPPCLQVEFCKLKNGCLQIHINVRTLISVLCNVDADFFFNFRRVG